MHFIFAFYINNPIQYGNLYSIYTLCFHSTNSIVKLGILMPAKICKKFCFPNHILIVKSRYKI